MPERSRGRYPTCDVTTIGSSACRSMWSSATTSASPATKASWACCGASAASSLRRRLRGSSTRRPSAGAAGGGDRAPLPLEPGACAGRRPLQL